jgi:uncharacterized protein HemX
MSTQTCDQSILGGLVGDKCETPAQQATPSTCDGYGPCTTTTPSSTPTQTQSASVSTPGSPPVELPLTSSTSGTLIVGAILLGLLLIAIGAALFRVTRRREPTPGGIHRAQQNNLAAGFSPPAQVRGEQRQP